MEAENNHKSDNIVWQKPLVMREDRQVLLKNRGAVLWFTGLSRSGKSTTAYAVENELHRRGRLTFVLDGDNIRHGLCKDLGFSLADREENIRRIAEVAKLFLDAGLITLVAFISPLRSYRAQARAVVGAADFVEVYCQCPIEECERRDGRGLYRRARSGEIPEFTGVSSPYEAPESADLVLRTAEKSVADSVSSVIEYLSRKGVLGTTATSASTSR